MKNVTAAVLLATCLAAQQPHSAVDLVLQRLGNRDAAAADAAMIDLIRGGPPNLPLLQRALAAAKEPACRTRIERALALCIVDAPIDNGLKVGLRADAKAVAPGDTVTLTATVCNVTDRPAALFLGMSYSGNVLENGLALQQCDRDGKALAQGRLGQVGFCGTGAHAIVEVVPPWSTKEFVVAASYRVAPPTEGCIRHDGPHLAVDYAYLPLQRAADGTLRVRLWWTVDPAVAHRGGEDAAKTSWAGTLVSNPIELTLRDAEAPRVSGEAPRSLGRAR
nr:hypothetical protein [Caldimonas sp.]